MGKKRNRAFKLELSAATCFFLGILFASFPYDFPLLWTSTAPPAAYYEQLEAHLRFMHGAPPLIGRLLNMAISVGLLGLALKLVRPSEANFLFDGATLILYLIGVAVYRSNIVHGLRAVAAAAPLRAHESSPLGRQDVFRDLAANNTILALVLVGILALQSGQWYAERKEQDDFRLIEAAERKEILSPHPRPATSRKSRRPSPAA